MSNLEKILKDVVAWQNETFSVSTETSKLLHLKEEVVELIEELEHPQRDWDKIRAEYADCFLLLFGSANKCGFNLGDIEQLMEHKLEINKKRIWKKADENGVYKHKKD